MTIEQAIKGLREQGKSASINTVSAYISDNTSESLESAKSRAKAWLFNTYPNAAKVIEGIA